MKLVQKIGQTKLSRLKLRDESIAQDSIGVKVLACHLRAAVNGCSSRQRGPLQGFAFRCWLLGERSAFFQERLS
jgi:hypothetical protein